MCNEELSEPRRAGRCRRWPRWSRWKTLEWPWNQEQVASLQHDCNAKNLLLLSTLHSATLSPVAGGTCLRARRVVSVRAGVLVRTRSASTAPWVCLPSFLVRHSSLLRSIVPAPLYWSSAKHAKYKTSTTSKTEECFRGIWENWESFMAGLSRGRRRLELSCCLLNILPAFVFPNHHRPSPLSPPLPRQSYSRLLLV